MPKPISEKKWAKIRNEYVTGEMGYRPLAEQHGIPLKTLAHRAKQEKWPELRRSHIDSVATELLQATHDEQLDKQYAHLLKLQESADKLVDIACAVMDDPESVKDTYGRYDPRRLRDLSSAVRELLTITRNVYDLPSIQERSAMDIAAERLKLEQRKVEQAEHDSNEGIEIVLGEGVKELAQ